METRVYQIHLKIGEQPASDNGKWRAYQTENGHIFGKQRGPFDTKEQATKAFAS
tara:strand:- start:32 stop:193 length:162 start_codon:yes stop_codon:yes gene_type:complete